MTTTFDPYLRPPEPAPPRRHRTIGHPLGGSQRGPRRPLPPLPGATAVAVWFAFSVALLAIWVFGFAFGLSAVQEQRTQQGLYSQFRTALTPSEAPAIGGNIAPDTPIALLQAPDIGLRDVVIVEGTASDDLREGPGHRRDTPLPGQAGVSVLMGRSVTYGAPFRDVSRLAAGDALTFLTGQGTFTYDVTDVRRAGDPLPTPLPAGESRVVLMTSEGSGWQRGWAPSHVVYVDAQLVNSVTDTVKASTAPVAAPPGQLAVIPADEEAMQGDSSALLPLILWLEALVVVAVGCAWGRGRWGRWQTWIVGVPLVLAVVWGATNCAMQLLPNLL
jgi:sortase A